MALIEIPYQFTNSQFNKIEAGELNDNFKALEEGINDGTKDITVRTATLKNLNVVGYLKPTSDIVSDFAPDTGVKLLTYSKALSAAEALAGSVEITIAVTTTKVRGISPSVYDVGAIFYSSCNCITYQTSLTATTATVKFPPATFAANDIVELLIVEAE